MITNITQTKYITDYPSGRKRVHCRFYVEQKGRKFRVCKQTSRVEGDDPVWCNPKLSTYADLAGVGEIDGKTVAILVHLDMGLISVLDHTLKTQILTFWEKYSPLEFQHIVEACSG